MASVSLWIQSGEMMTELIQNRTNAETAARKQSTTSLTPLISTTAAVRLSNAIHREPYFGKAMNQREEVVK